MKFLLHIYLLILKNPLISSTLAIFRKFGTKAFMMTVKHLRNLIININSFIILNQNHNNILMNEPNETTTVIGHILRRDSSLIF